MSNCKIRVGQGYDVHRLVEGRPLILGGVQIPHSLGLDGHSDADVLLHAVTDALFGAAAMGDIGRHFPDTDPAYKGADSTKLLSEALKKVWDKGWKPVNRLHNHCSETETCPIHEPDQFFFGCYIAASRRLRERQSQDQRKARL